MDWIKKFYSTTGTWWGPAEVKVTERDHERLNILKRLHGSQPKTVLELGSSYGNTASVMAEAGIHVTAIEISDRADFAKQYSGKKYPGSLEILKDDFYKVQLPVKFDAVCYWNGFGIGSDEDQRALLRRISQDWLKPDGSLLMDIQNPFVWASWNGDEEHKKARPEVGYNFNVSQQIKFDPVNNRMYDTWWLTDDPTQKFEQTIRCYSPADLSLLIEGTGLKLTYMEVEGKKLEWDSRIPKDHTFWEENEYLTQLKLT